MSTLSKLSVLFVTSEVYPLVKTGGLADVSHALPKALREMDVDTRLLIPGYPAVLDQLSLTCLYEGLPLFPAVKTVRLLRGTIPDGNIPVYVIDCPQLYARPGSLYQDATGKDWPDNAIRFATLCKLAALFGAQQLTFKPSIVHCNDWQSGLTAAYLHYTPEPRARVITSVHNLAYQGIFPATMVTQIGLPLESFNMYGLEYYGQLSFLKGGLFYADWITTVSPTYAKEIQTVEQGCGLNILLAQQQHKLTGILNGIDAEAWNPATDTYLTNHYSIGNLTGKAYNTQALRIRLGLASTKAPLIGMITRLTPQKGLDLVIPIIDDILKEGAQMVLLGNGDKEIEKELTRIAKEHPNQLSVNLRYDEALAHQIEAGADIFLMPSRFEPCGLTQMYGMRYGTVPVVRCTGGLTDTVVDATPITLDKQTATGFVFNEEDPRQLFLCIQRALLTFRDKTTWRMLQTNGMSRDFSWQSSAYQYVSLYRSLAV